MPGTRHTRGSHGGEKSSSTVAEADLCNAFLTLKDPAELRRFLYDLCTPKEIVDMSERWWVARLLDSGKYSYREIHNMTGVSVTTIGRVARFLEQEPFQGYRVALDRRRRS